MKLSVSLSESDVAILDRYAADHRLGSRSAAVQLAVRRLADEGLERDYEEAWNEWNDTGEAEVWDAVAGDGVVDASR